MFFEAVLAPIGELSSDFASDLIVRGEGDADAARFCDALKPRRDVNAVSKDVMGLDDYVADVDADAESNTPVFGIASCKFTNARLELHSSSNRLDRARKLCQEPVAGVLYDAAAVFRDCGLADAREERLQLGVRGLFAMVHEPRIAGHVGGQYRRQSAFDPDWRFLHHGSQPNPTEHYDGSDGGASRALMPRRGSCRLLARTGPTAMSSVLPLLRDKRK